MFHFQPYDMSCAKIQIKLVLMLFVNTAYLYQIIMFFYLPVIRTFDNIAFVDSIVVLEGAYNYYATIGYCVLVHIYIYILYYTIYTLYYYIFDVLFTCFPVWRARTLRHLHFSNILEAMERGRKVSPRERISWISSSVSRMG